MGYGKQAKELMMKEVQRILKKAPNLIVTGYDRLPHREVMLLRGALHNRDADYIVIKRSIARLALKGSNKGVALDWLEDLAPDKTLAFAFGNDAMGLSRAISDFIKGHHEEFLLKGGILEGHSLSSEKILEIATIPPKEVLLTQLIRGMRSPLIGLVNSLSGMMRKLVCVLEEIRKSRV